MALTKNLTLRAYGQDVTVNNAYIRVTSVMGTKYELKGIATVLDSTATAELTTLAFSFIPDMSGQNFIAQSYNHLKTLPEFSDAVDC